MTRSRAGMDHKVHRLLVWSGPVMVLSGFVGLIPLAGWIPPASPTLNSQQIVAMYTGNLFNIRLACIVMTVGFALYGIWAAALVIWTRRLESGHPILTYASLVCVSTGMVVLEIAPLSWTWAAFRPGEIDPDITRSINDIGWILFEYPWPPFFILLILQAIAIFRDVNEVPFYPRWVAYMDLMIAVSYVPGSLVLYFRTGPFAFNGVLALFVPLSTFFIWMVVMTAVTLKLIKRDEDQTLLSRPEGDPALVKQ